MLYRQQAYFFSILSFVLVRGSKAPLIGGAIFKLAIYYYLAYASLDMCYMF